MEDDMQCLSGHRSKVKVARSHDQSEPSWPNAVPVSLEAGEGIPVVVSGMQLTIAHRHTSTSSSTEGGSEPKSATSGSVRWCCFRSRWMVLSHVMRGRPSCLLQSAGGEANMILLASALSSMRIICPNRVSWHDWIIAVSLGCFVSLRTSSFRTTWYHLMPSSICRHHWSSASILRASVRLRYRPAIRTMQEYW